jgi:hypothetical protein
MVGLEDYGYIFDDDSDYFVDVFVSLHVIVYRCKPNIWLT